MKFQSENERIVEGIVFGMEGYIVSSSSIVRSRKEKLIEHLDNQDYKKFYRLIEKMAKESKKTL